MEGHKKPKIFVYFGLDENIDFLFKKCLYPFGNIRYVCRQDEIETANPNLTDSKLYGLIAFHVANGYDIFIPGMSLLSKKKTFAFSFHFNKLFGKNIAYDLFFVDAAEEIEILQKGERISFDRCAEIVTTSSRRTPNFDDISLTYGYLADFSWNNYKENGHVTWDYALSFDDYSKFAEHHANKFDKEHKHVNGEVLKFTVISENDKTQVGHVISCPSLDDPTHSNRHITFRSPIKAVLSGPIVGKYLEGKLQFKLSEIDPETKKDAQINIESLGFTEVDTTTLYVYVIPK